MRRLRTHGLLAAIVVALAGSLGAPPPHRPRRAIVYVQHDPAWKLALLSGIGDARAEALTVLRQRHPLYGPQDMQRVPGIGARRARQAARSQEVRVVWAVEAP